MTMIGQVIDQYKVVKIMAKTAIADSFLAVHTEGGQKFVLKAVNQKLFTVSGFKRRLIDDSVKIIQLDQPNVVSLANVLDEGAAVFTVYEYVEGQSLDRVLKEKPTFPLENIEEIAMDCLAGIDYAYQQGYIHHFLQPKKLIITPSGTTRILDFGDVLQVAKEKYRKKDKLIRPALYFSPQRFGNPGLSDVRTSIYSLGIILFEAATGRLPFVAKTYDELANLHAQRPFPDPRELNPQVSEGIASLIIKACQKRPEDRFQNISEMQQALAANQPPANQPEPTDLLGGFGESWGSVGESSEESFDFGYENTGQEPEPASPGEAIVAPHEFAADMHADSGFAGNYEEAVAPADSFADAAIEFEAPREKGGFASAGANDNPDLISAHEFPDTVEESSSQGFDFGTGPGAEADDDFGFGNSEKPADIGEGFSNGDDDPFGFGDATGEFGGAFSTGTGDESFDTAKDLASGSGDNSNSDGFDFGAPQSEEADIGFGFGTPPAEPEVDDFGFEPTPPDAESSDPFGFGGAGPDSGSSDSFDFGSSVLDKNDGTFDFGTGLSEDNSASDSGFNAASTVSNDEDGFDFDASATKSEGGDSFGSGDDGFDFGAPEPPGAGDDGFDFGAPEPPGSGGGGFDFGAPEPPGSGSDGFDFDAPEPPGSGGDGFDFGAPEPPGSGSDGFDFGAPEPPGSGSDGFDFGAPDPPGSGGDGFDFGAPEPPGSGDDGFDFGTPEPPGSGGEAFDFGAPEPPGSGDGFDFTGPEPPGSGDVFDFGDAELPAGNAFDGPGSGTGSGDEFNFGATSPEGNDSFDMPSSIQDDSLGLGSSEPDPISSSFNLEGDGNNGFDFESAEDQGSAFDFDSAADPFGDSSADPGKGAAEEDAFAGFDLEDSGFPSGSTPTESAENTFSTEDGAFSFEAVDDSAGTDLDKPSTFDEPELSTDVPLKRTEAKAGLESSIAALEHSEKAGAKKAKKPRVVRKFEKKTLAITGGLAILVIVGLGYLIISSRQSKRDKAAEAAIQNLVDDSRYELAIAKLDEYEPSASSASKKRLKQMRVSIEDDKANVEKQIDTLLLRASEFEEQGKMLTDGKNDAFGQYRKILSMYANHPKATEQGERIKKIQMDRADELLEGGDELGALDVLKALNTGDRSDRVVREKYQGLQERLNSERSDALKASLEKNYAKGQYQLMLNELEELERIDSKSKFVKDMRRTLVNNFQQRGQEQMSRRKYDEAEQSYANALRLDPNNQEALRARDELTETKLRHVIEGKRRKLDRAVANRNFKRQAELASELANLDPGNQSANSALDGVTAEVIRLRNEAEQEREKGHFKKTAGLYKTIYEINGSEEARGLWLKLERWAPPPRMAYVPGSGFNMGSRANSNSFPVRKVMISSYFIDKYEVTNGEFKEFVDANPQWHPSRIDPNKHDGRYLKHWTRGAPKTDDLNRPVCYVSWYAARAYAEWRGKRLPTEAEWEKAAKGKTKDKEFWWGNYSDAKKAVYEFYAEKKPAPVGTFPANNYDVHEILGNITEWVEDTYDPEFYRKAKGEQDPVNTASGREKVLRGGSYKSRGRDLALHLRDHNDPRFCHMTVGFRCAKMATAEP